MTQNPPPPSPWGQQNDPQQQQPGQPQYGQPQYGQQPYGQPVGGGLAPAPTPEIGQPQPQSGGATYAPVPCAMCSASLPWNQMYTVQNQYYVCPTCYPSFMTNYSQGVPGGTPMWREGKTLVLNKGASLPDRCVKCNSPGVVKRFNKKLSWAPPWVIVTILAGLIVYIIVYYVLRKQGEVSYGLCETHEKKRKTHILITWLLSLGCIASLFLAFPLDAPGLFLVFIVLLLAALIYGGIAVPILKPTKIDDQYLWVKGAGPEFLHSVDPTQG